MGNGLAVVVTLALRLRTALWGAFAALVELACKPEPAPDFRGAVEWLGLEGP